MKYNYKYGKLQNNNLCYAPNKLVIDNEQVFNADADTYLTFGYMPVVNTEAPQSTEQYYYIPYYTVENEAIIQHWEQVEIPVENEATEQDYLEALAKLGVK